MNGSVVSWQLAFEPRAPVSPQELNIESEPREKLSGLSHIPLHGVVGAVVQK
jgi:hypothetical protein